MALTLNVGGGSGLVAMNRGLRTCSDGGLSWAWWVRPWAAVNLVLAGFVTFGYLGCWVMMWWWSVVVWLVGLWWGLGRSGFFGFGSAKSIDVKPRD